MSESASGEASDSCSGNDKEFSCDKCGSKHDTQRGLSIHESRSHGGPVDGSGIDCPGCERSFASQQGVVRHLSGESSCGGGFECSKCGRSFPSKRGWKQHQKEVHDNDTRPVVECAWCGETQQVDPNRAEQSERHFCSRECCGNWKAENLVGEDNPQYDRLTKECKSCGESYNVIPSRSDSMFCSEPCRGDWMRKKFSGKDSFRWKGGSVRHYGDNWEQQRRKALERDNYTCQACGKDMSDSDRDPDVHHIKRLGFFEEKYDAPTWWQKGNKLENLICLCRPCHNEWEGIPLKPELL